MASLSCVSEILLSTKWTKQTASAFALERIKKDVSDVFNLRQPDIFIHPEEDDITLIHALLSGRVDTNYEGGFFYFLLQMPFDYPMHPPRVKLMTTGEGTVRFGPHLHADGEVDCVFGSSEGSKWSPAETLCDVLLSIQSLMRSNPYNSYEPGLESTAWCNRKIEHETLRVAVCDMIQKSSCDSIYLPRALRLQMEKAFLKNFDHYLEVCKLRDGDYDQAFNFDVLFDRLVSVKFQLEAVPPNTVDDEVMSKWEVLAKYPTNSGDAQVEYLDFFEEETEDE